MKKKLLLLLSSLFILTSSNAQSFIKYWDKTYGGDKLESAGNILYSGGNELILSGHSQTNINGDKTDPLCNAASQNMWVLKIDTSLNILWQNDLGGNVQETFVNSSLTDNPYKFIFSCQSYSDSGCDKSENSRGYTDYWICLIDSGGNKIWDKTLGGSLSDRDVKIIQLSSGDYIISGQSGSQISGDKTVPLFGGADYWVVKFDTLGNKIWDKDYGGSMLEELSASVALADNSFILAGLTDSPPGGSISDTSRGLDDLWIIKIDSAGNKIWDKRFGGSGSENCLCVNPTPDKGLILCGFTFSPQDGDVSDPPRGGEDYWIIKTDSMGNKQWDKRYGGFNEERATCVKPALDGGYWVLGYTNSDSCADISEHGYGTDYWVLKLDSMGNKLWDKRFGGYGNNISTNFIYMPDSSLILFGYADSGSSPMKTDAGKGNSDYWLVRFKYSDSSTGIHENTSENNLLSIYPNPTNGKVILNSSTKAKAEVYIHDVMGKEVFYKKDIFLNHYEINISDFDKGVYLLNVKTGESIFTKKLVKL